MKVMTLLIFNIWQVNSSDITEIYQNNMSEMKDVNDNNSMSPQQQNIRLFKILTLDLDEYNQKCLSLRCNVMGGNRNVHFEILDYRIELAKSKTGSLHSFRTYAFIIYMFPQNFENIVNIINQHEGKYSCNKEHTGLLIFKYDDTEFSRKLIKFINKNERN